MANKSSWLSAGAYLSVNDYLVSDNGLYFAIMQPDGNFVLYYGSGPSSQGPVYWASNTVLGQGQYFAIMQGDANFVLYQGSDPTHQGAFCWGTMTVSGVITVHNQGGYVARSTVEYDLIGQHQSQSSGNFTAGQTYSVPTPIGATNIHVKCEEETSLVWDPWKTILDKRYSTPPQKTFTLTGTTLNQGFNEQ